MTRVLWIEIRRSPLRWWLPVLVALDLAVLFGRGQWWIGIWPQASVAAQIPCFYFGPALAAAAAWSAGRSTRTGFTEQLSAGARARHWAEFAQLASTLVFGVLAYLAGIVVAAAVSASEAGPGFLWPGYLLLGLALVVLCAGIGHLVGRWSRSQFAGPVICGLGCLVALGWYGAPSQLGLFALNGHPATTVAWLPLAARVALAGSVAAVAVTAARPVLRRAGRSWRSWPRGSGRYAVLGSVLALAVSVAALPGSGRLLTTRSAPPNPVCTQTSPRFCLWPEDRKYVPGLTAMAGRLAELPPDLFRLPPTFYEQGLRRPDRQAIDFYPREGSLWEATQGIAIGILQASTPAYCKPATPEAGMRQSVAEGDLIVWLSARLTGAGQPSTDHGGPPGVDIPAIGRFIHEPEPAQLAWVREHLRTIRETPCA